MKAIVARCGFRCDTCVAFVKNSRTATDRCKAAAGWSKYFHLNVKPDAMRCNGCLAKDCDDYEFPVKNCATRQCVIDRGLNNCSECAEYPCEKLDKRMKGVDRIIKRFQGQISKQEFDCFIAPYDARTTLNRLRRA
jgi:hypothetical protein